MSTIKQKLTIKQKRINNLFVALYDLVENQGIGSDELDDLINKFHINYDKHSSAQLVLNNEFGTLVRNVK